MEGKKLKM